MFTKIPIAHRGEIVCRVIETARRIGIQTVAVPSGADKYQPPFEVGGGKLDIGPAAASSRRWTSR